MADPKIDSMTTDPEHDSVLTNHESDSTIISTRRSKDLQSFFFKKSHRLVFSSLSLTPVEHDILALFLTRLHKDHWEPFMQGKQVHSPTYSFSIDVLTEWFGVNSSSMYSTLSLPSKRLNNKSIGIRDEVKKRFMYTSLFKRISYENGCLEIIPNDLLINEYLAISGGHSQVPHRVFRDIKSEHAKRLYTMLCRYRNHKFHVFHPQSLTDLHAYFGLLDEHGKIRTKSYGTVGKFVQLILNPAIKEISDSEPNIEFLYESQGKNQKFGIEYIKEGRKVTAIRFLFKWNKSKETAKDEADKRKEIEETKSALELAEMTYEILQSFEPSDSGNPTVGELNNMMSMSPQLMEKGCELDAALMTNFAKAMAEAKLRPDPSNPKSPVTIDGEFEETGASNGEDGG